MSFNRQFLFEMLETLGQTKEVLRLQHNADFVSDVVPTLHDFVITISEHIKLILPEDTEIDALVTELLDLFKSVPINEQKVNDHIPYMNRVIKRLVFSAMMQAESNFHDYIDLLVEAVKNNFCVLITTSDTPCGSPNFTEYLGSRLCLTGLKTNLFDKWRVSYCAVIDGSKVLEENMSETHSVKCRCLLENNEIVLTSVGYGKVDDSRHCSIVINGKQTAVGGIGLSFVVFDKYSDFVLDSVCFNTYSREIDCIRNTDSAVVKEFKRNNPGVTFINPRFPSFPKRNLSKNEQWIIDNRINHSHLKANPKLTSAIYEYINNAEDIIEVLSVPPSYIGTDGSRYFQDHKGKYVNTVNGHRVTTNQPPNPQRSIFVLGGCAALGIGVRDEGTFASGLQQLLNLNAAEEGFIVENYAFTLNGTAEHKQLDCILSALPVKPGDVVIGYGEGIPSYNLKLEERPYQNGELFFDDVHFTETAHSMIADALFETLKQNDFFRDTIGLEQLPPAKKAAYYSFSNEQLKLLSDFKAKLSNSIKSRSTETDRVGAIVMNCNPFTLGHRYLIEESSKKVDTLIVFVVQEDKSFFPFEERIDLVKRGVADLSNVIVIESGNFIISTITFEEYFNKSDIQDKIVDSSMDVTIFANEIAPAANIKIRFVGSEPFDKITNQYNRTLARILPQFGIAFEEIPRKDANGITISASNVRELLSNKDWAAIRTLVPDVTYEYLLSK